MSWGYTDFAFLISWSDFFYLILWMQRVTTAPDHTKGHTHTHTHTHSRTPLDEGSARRRDFYLETHNIHNRLTPMPPVAFESGIPASERPQTHAFGRVDPGIGSSIL